MNFDLPKPFREPENKNEQITISLISPESTDDISAYYQFEIDQDFSQVNPKTTFDNMVNFRQQQIQNALNNNYEGVYLLRPEDFEKPKLIDSNLIVFVKK